MPVEIEFDVEADAGLGARLANLAAQVMSGEGAAPEATLTVLLTSDERIHALNLEFLGSDYPTDVLSFPGATEGMPPDTPPHIGDLAIAIGVARRQADAMGHSLEAEMDHLLVHGILHLFGYDHEQGGVEGERMRTREEHYLGGLAHFHGDGTAS
jgi:probable rRNA maturation factor